MNAKLGGMDPAKVDPQTVLFFESDGDWNANGDLGNMIIQPRHGSLVVALADGSVQQVPKERALTLRWEP